MQPYLLSQAIGTLGIPLAYLQYQLSTRQLFLLTNATSGLLYCFQLGILAEYSGAILGLLPVVTSTFYALKKEELCSGWKWAIGASATITAWAASPQGIFWWWWLPLLGFVIARIAEASKNNHRMRHTFLVSATVWGTYAAYCSAWAALLADLVAVYSNLVWLRQSQKRKVPC